MKEGNILLVNGDSLKSQNKGEGCTTQMRGKQPIRTRQEHQQENKVNPAKQSRKKAGTKHWLR